MNIEPKTIRSIADAVWDDKQHDLNGNGNSKSFAVQNTNDQVNHIRRDLAAQGAKLDAIVGNIDKTSAGFKDHVTKEVDRAVSAITETKEE